MGGCCCSSHGGARRDAVPATKGAEEAAAEEEEEVVGGSYEEEEEEEDGSSSPAEAGETRVRTLEGSTCGVAAMHTRQGRKGVNQDAMTVWQGFAGEKDSIFCGVFDGHGALGHRVARHVRDALPAKLAAEYRRLKHPGASEEALDGSNASAGTTEEDERIGCGGDIHGEVRSWFDPWKKSFLQAFKCTDDELDRGASIDCICSGTTAVAVVKQKDRLIIANLGDSRAVLCTRDGANKLVPVQLTVDLKPDLPGEARRITSCEGRVFALQEEPDVYRMWLPDENCPGLAMARAFGDFCLKQFGLISVPEVTYRELTGKDEFVVLATDGVWDVLSNKDVVKIVSSAAKRSQAAKKVVDRAVSAWAEKHPGSKVDDCAVVCLFLNPPSSYGGPRAAAAAARGRAGRKCREPSFTESFETARSGTGSESFHSTNAADDVVGGEERTALDGGMSRSDSLTTKVPRSSGWLMGWRRGTSGKTEQNGFARK